jgi:hypothetical protein
MTTSNKNTVDTKSNEEIKLNLSPEDEIKINTILENLNPGGTKTSFCQPLEIHTNLVRFIFQKGNLNLTKDISLLDFKKLINSIIAPEVNEILEPLSLPFGCFSLARGKNNLELNCYYPGGKKDILYKGYHSSGVSTINIPFPNTIISHRLKQGTKHKWDLVSTKYYCTPKTVGQLSDSLLFIERTDKTLGVHRLPFSNVYDNNCLCYGNNSIPKSFSNNIRGLDYFYQLLFISPFNDDLGIRGVNGSYSVAEWYKYLSELDTFPYDLLY